MRPRTAIQGLIFFAVVFFLFPSLFISLNQEWGWPVLTGSVVSMLGWLLIGAGAVVSVYCSNLFRQLGQGTPVPSEPPTALVTAGLYSYSRNPIYVADLAILLGIFLAFGHFALLLYPVLFFVFVEALLVLHEEPVLQRRFGAQYEAYKSRVPRWVGRAAAT